MNGPRFLGCFFAAFGLYAAVGAFGLWLTYTPEPIAGNFSAALWIVWTLPGSLVGLPLTGRLGLSFSRSQVVGFAIGILINGFLFLPIAWACCRLFGFGGRRDVGGPGDDRWEVPDASDVARIVGGRGEAGRDRGDP